MKLFGLSNVNIELTSRCNKKCWMCGRRAIEKENPKVAKSWGDMSLEMAGIIAQQLPSGVVVQLHNNGEPLLYPEFGRVVKLFNRQITNIVTNGKLLMEKSKEIIGKLDTLAVSIIQDDSSVEKTRQYSQIKRFLKEKKNRKPFTVLRIVGEVDTKRYTQFGVPITKRNLHSPMGSFDYDRRRPTIPEIGICLEILHHLAIDRHGNVSICVRFDPNGLGVLGNLREQTLEDIWIGTKRMTWMAYHKYGRRDKVPLCSHCDYWGVPTGGK